MVTAAAQPHRLLVVERLSKSFAARGGTFWSRARGEPVRAVTDVSFSLTAGEVLGIVGESGSGKTTLARMLLRLIEPSEGVVKLRGRNIFDLSRDDVRSFLRPKVRMVFQDPDAALNPAYTVGVGLRRALQLQRPDVDAAMAGEQIGGLLEHAGLDASFLDKFPDELSGGEKRRIGICRALLTDPEVIVADEPLSGLDVVLQERILQLLKLEQGRRGFGVILVSHDLDRVNQVCDRVLVMHGGRVVEETVLRRGEQLEKSVYRHPYSIMLQRARDSVAGTSQAFLEDVAPDLHDANAELRPERSRSTGCSVAPKCSRRRALGDPETCWTTVPKMVHLGEGHTSACHFADSE